MYLWTRQPVSSSWCAGWQYPDTKFDIEFSVSPGKVTLGSKTIEMPDAPATGDSFPIALLGAMAAVSAAAVILLRRRKV